MFSRLDAVNRIGLCRSKTAESFLLGAKCVCAGKYLRGEGKNGELGGYDIETPRDYYFYWCTSTISKTSLKLGSDK